jgi:hypothetical protein
MRLSGKFRWIVLSIAIAALLPFAPVDARAATSADKTAQAAPDPNANEMLANFIKQGAKAYYMGTRGGLDGWFVVKDSKVQIMYAPVGSQYILVGVLFQPGGQNLTIDQIKQTAKEHPEIVAMLNAKQGQSVPAGVGQPSSLAAQDSTPTSASADEAAQHPGEKLMKDLMEANGVTLGSPTAPRLLMVMDTQCRHCRATWGILRDAVLKNTLQVRMIPIGDQDSESERAGAQFLHVTNPLNSWDKYYNGDTSPLAGTPDASQIAALRANHALIDSWHIDFTPWLIYRAKSGEVKIIRGELQEPLATLLSDMAP